MIQKPRFLGISLRTRQRRRTLVLAYYAVLLLLISPCLWKQKMLPAAMIIQTLTLGGFFGGIRSEGVVKPYSDEIREPGYSGIQELNLNGLRAFAARPLLDEREVHERDRTHYTAYCILRWSMGVVGTLYVVGMMAAPTFLANNIANFLWIFIVFVLSLPQSIILWTEPEPLPEAGLTLVRQH
jgi:hypothetical protein